MATRIVNRITVADIIRGAKQQKLDKDGQPLFDDKKQPVMGSIEKTLREQDLYMVVGRARESKEGTTQYGTYDEYFGVFEATRLTDGEVFHANRCIFPEPTAGVVHNIFLDAKSKDPASEVAFAFVIGVQPFTRGDETKFRHTCKPLSVGALADLDPLAEIKAAIADEAKAFLPGAAKALEAPKAPAPAESEAEPAEQGKAKK